MTKKEYLIDMLSKNISAVDKSVIAEIFNILNQYKWDVFSSVMGDYDYPEERVQAKIVKNKKLEALIVKDDVIDGLIADAIEQVRLRLYLFDYPENRFYRENFYTLNTEYKG